MTSISLPHLFVSVLAMLLVAIPVFVRLGRVAVALGEIAVEWTKNRAVGQEKDKVLEGFRDLIAARLDAGLAEVRALIEQSNTKCEQRHQVSEARYSDFASRLASAETSIKELAILVRPPT